MSFDGETFVEEMRQELIPSARTLDQADWVKRVEQGEATPQDLVGWGTPALLGPASTTGGH